MVILDLLEAFGIWFFIFGGAFALGLVIAPIAIWNATAGTRYECHKLRVELHELKDIIIELARQRVDKPLTSQDDGVKAECVLYECEACELEMQAADLAANSGRCPGCGKEFEI